MANGCTHFFLLCWFAFLFLTGLTLFSRGFLLKRLVLPDLGTCSNGTNRHLKALNLNETVEELLSKKTDCWLPARFNKAVILIIDGLRYDFVTYNENLTESEILPFQNKLTFLHQLLESQPNHAAVFKFMADPPTTTMQRIKGLITGSLPTFIDVSANFASFEISEDNIIDQLVAQKKRITFLGDDTWMGLLPQRFQKSFPFPSFNVKDLHTVDNGIIKHLVPEIHNKDWDMLVAHFLGVDHCGHRYGPYHSAMAEKLNQMNDVLRSVVESLNSDTILFVMGDHGMTKTGDHGGDSTDEISAALFVYSRKKLWNAKVSSLSEIRQIDFAPTFSLLMGIPIPFGNLGRVVSDLYTVDDEVGKSIDHNMDKKYLGNLYLIALALYTNVKQVELYLAKYNSISQELVLESESFFKIQQLVNDTENLLKSLPFLPASVVSESLYAIQTKCITYLTSARNICQNIWAHFDCISIITGLCIFALSLFLASGQVFLGLQTSLKPAMILFIFSVFGSAFLIHSSFPLLTLVQGNESNFAIIIAAISSLLYICCVWGSSTPDAIICQEKSASNITCKLSFICGVLLFSFLFSNSFVINEASLSSYFTVTVLWWEVLTSYPTLKNLNNESKRKSKLELLPKSRLWCIIFALLSTVCIRTLSMFWKCREEQWWCEGSDFLRSLANIPIDTVEYVSYKNWRFFVSVCSVLLIVAAMRWLMRKAGNMNGFAPAVLCASYAPIFIGICTCFYWALQGLSSNVSNQVLLQYQVVLPNVVFVVAIISIFILFLRPLCIYTVHNEAEEIGPIMSSDTGHLFHQVYRHLKANWQKHFLSTGVRTGSSRNQLMVYGLASVFSASLITVVTLLMLTLMMLSSDGLAPAFLLLIMASAFILYCLASLREDGIHAQNIFQVPWSWVLLWSLFASVGFYATGHQQTFPALYWESAIIGTDGNFNNHVLPAIKVLLNTFSCTVLAGISLPLLLLWPFANRIIFDKQNHFPIEMDDGLKKGEFYLYENPAFFSSLYHLTCKYLIIQGAKLFTSMAAAALLRRHLMVWKIFAPRFLFEAVNFLLTIPAVLSGFLLMMSVHAALVSWMKKLDQHEHNS